MASRRTIELPLFPLHSVLCPGVALPLHVFEERYRLMIARCLDRDEPFGVVLIREGRDAGGGRTRVADVGTTALIREAGRYPDGRIDIVTVGGERFRVEALDDESEPYLVGHVTLLGEPLGDAVEARRLARRVSQRFLHYLELLQPALDDDGPEIEVEIEVDDVEATNDDEDLELVVEVEVEGAVDEASGETEGLEQGGGHGGSIADALNASTDAERMEALMAAARRLAAPDDPTALSYVLGGLVQVELPSRQSLLEAPDTATRLVRLDRLLTREIQLLGRRLKPLILDPNMGPLRRN
jgi:Lon protease-like protein